MESSREKDKDKHEAENIVGMGYDGRRDKHTPAMVADSSGKLKMIMVTEEHESVTNEPSGHYSSYRRLNKHEHGVEVSQPCTP